MIERNGKLYARVSDVIKPFSNLQGIPQEILNNKASIGTNVHNAIKQEIEGEFPVVGLQEQGYVHSFEKWRSALNPTFIEMEVRYYCDQKMITGCIDAVIKLQGEEKAILIDYKTSVQESPTWIMQAHLYHYLLNMSGKEMSSRFLCIKLDKNGYAPRVIEYKFNTSQIAKCFQAINTFWEKQNIALNSDKM